MLNRLASLMGLRCFKIQRRSIVTPAILFTLATIVSCAAASTLSQHPVLAYSITDDTTQSDVPARTTGGTHSSSAGQDNTNGTDSDSRPSDQGNIFGTNDNTGTTISDSQFPAGQASDDNIDISGNIIAIAISIAVIAGAGSLLLFSKNIF